MRILLDACVLYPTVLRGILLDLAENGAFTPLWSARILNEWSRAAIRNAPHTEPLVGAEIALLSANWPNAGVTIGEADRNLWLPDENDIHVLQAAIDGRADQLLTANTQDFPTRILSSHGILRRAPDEFLLELAHAMPEQMAQSLENIRTQTERDLNEPQVLPKLLKRVRLPRLAKHYRA